MPPPVSQTLNSFLLPHADPPDLTDPVSWKFDKQVGIALTIICESNIPTLVFFPLYDYWSYFKQYSWILNVLL